MVSGKSHLSLQAPANRAGSAAAVAPRPETELTLIAEVREAEMRDAELPPILIFGKGKWSENEGRRLECLFSQNLGDIFTHLSLINQTRGVVAAFQERFHLQIPAI